MASFMVMMDEKEGMEGGVINFLSSSLFPFYRIFAAKTTAESGGDEAARRVLQLAGLTFRNKGVRGNSDPITNKIKAEKPR